MRKQVVDLSVANENRDEKIKTILGRLDELESQLHAYWEDTKGPAQRAEEGERGDRQPRWRTQRAPPKTSTSRASMPFRKGHTRTRCSLFAQFVQQNPTAPLAPNAYYWMGESYMNLKVYEKAIVQFQEVIDKFPRSDKAARAMLRQAEAFAAIGDKKSSTTALKRVIELFPKTEEARLANRALRSGTFQ